MTNDKRGSLVFTASDDALDASDERWERELQALLADLKEQVGPIDRVEEHVDGNKGVDVSAIILALGSAGAITAAVEVFKAWLGANKRRRVEFEYFDEDGKARSLRVSGVNIDETTLRQAVRLATK